jgi:hypothetical protein
MQSKFPQYPHVYLFGKDHGDKTKVKQSLREKRKNRGSMTHDYMGLGVVSINEELANSTVQSAFDRFKSEEGLLVVIVSAKQLVTSNS